MLEQSRNYATINISHSIKVRDVNKQGYFAKIICLPKMFQMKYFKEMERDVANFFEILSV